jgi:hypothetical protein
MGRRIASTLVLVSLVGCAAPQKLTDTPQFKAELARSDRILEVLRAKYKQCLDEGKQLPECCKLAGGDQAEYEGKPVCKFTQSFKVKRE